MLKKRIQRFHDRFISLKGEPRAIAMGMAVGIFVGVTPTIPFHTALIILFGLIWKHNLTSAYLGSWLISNPVTIPLFYLGQYELGKYLLGMNPGGLTLADYSIRSVFSMGWHVLLPLLTGGLIMAPLFAIPSYFITYRVLLALRNRNRT